MRDGRFPQTLPADDDLPAERAGEPTYDPSAWQQVPEEYRSWTLTRLTSSRVERDHLAAFLASRYAAADLACWTALESLRRVGHGRGQQRDATAKHIKSTFLTKKYFFGPNSPASRAGQDKVRTLTGAGGRWWSLTVTGGN